MTETRVKQTHRVDLYFDQTVIFKILIYLRVFKQDIYFNFADLGHPWCRFYYLFFNGVSLISLKRTKNHLTGFVLRVHTSLPV